MTRAITETFGKEPSMDTSLDKQVGGHLCGAASTKGCGEQNQDRFRITPDGILLLDGSLPTALLSVSGK